MTLSVKESDVATEIPTFKTREAFSTLGKENERAHVLVADDDDALRGLLTNLLQRDGYQVSAAATGQEAVGIVASRGVDVALIDVKMPDLNGIEVLKRSKKIDPGIEAVIITGSSGPDTAEEALKNGAYDFIRKPFADIKQIPRCVRRAAEKRRMFQYTAALMSEISTQKRLLDEKVAELRLLYQMSKSIAYALDYERLSCRLLEVFLSLTSVEACSALLPRGNPPILIVRSRREMEERLFAEAKELLVKEANELTSLNLSAEAVNLLPGYLLDDSDGAGAKPASTISGQWSLGVIVEGRMVCILSMLAFDDGKVSPDEMRLFSTMAEHASQIIEGVRRASRVERGEV